MKAESTKLVIPVIIDNISTNAEFLTHILAQVTLPTTTSQLDEQRTTVHRLLADANEQLKRAITSLSTALAEAQRINTPAPKPGIRRFLFVNGVPHEATLEECAQADGLSISEYLALEAVELADSYSA